MQRSITIIGNNSITHNVAVQMNVKVSLGVNDLLYQEWSSKLLNFYTAVIEASRYGVKVGVVVYTF